MNWLSDLGNWLVLFYKNGCLTAVLRWWGWMALLGVIFVPIVRRIFGGGVDKGYALAKMLSLALVSYVVWLGASLHVFGFTRVAILFTMLAALPFAAGIFWQDIKLFEFRKSWKYILIEEALFLVALAAWAAVRSIRPDFSDIEKPMDYAFMNACLAGDHFPPADPWYAGEPINYYYFGQYIAAFLARLSGTPSEIGYNLMTATTFAATFLMAFAIVANAVFYLRGRRGGVVAVAGGLIASLLMCLGGSLHTFVYAVLPRILQPYVHADPLQSPAFSNWINGASSYHWADATRYIGYNPETNDKTITEFAAYSFTLGDLHAHLVDLMLVMAFVLALIYFVCEQRTRPQGRPLWRALLDDVPALVTLALMLGVFFITNTWDFLIYTGLFGLALLIRVLSAGGNRWQWLSIGCGQLGVVVVIALLAASPFILRFVSPAKGAHVVEHRSPLWQLAVIYGYQWFFVIWYLVALLVSYLRRPREVPAMECGGNVAKRHDAALDAAAQNNATSPKEGQASTTAEAKAAPCPVGTVPPHSIGPALFTWLPMIDRMILACLAIAAVCTIIPEVVYVKDIYGPEYHRTNTIFKFGYQAAMLLTVTAAFIYIRLCVGARRWWSRIPTVAAGLIVLALPLCFMPYAIRAYYFDNQQWRYDAEGRPLYLVNGPHRSTPSLDGLDFIRKDHPDDYAMIQFLREQGPPAGAILETDRVPVVVNGQTIMESSYKYTERISMSTGWPTVLGWWWHELLWRNGVKDFEEIMERRKQDIQEIYTGKDPRRAEEDKRTPAQVAARTEELLRKYDVRYIIVADAEHSAFPNLDEANLMAVGHVVFRASDESFIIEVSRE